MKKYLLTTLIIALIVGSTSAQKSDSVEKAPIPKVNLQTELLNESVQLQNNAAKNLQSAMANFEGDIELYKWLATILSAIFGAVAIIAIRVIYKQEDFFKQKKDEVLKEVSVITASKKEVETAIERVKLHEIEIAQLKNTLSETEANYKILKDKYSLQNDIDLLRRNFSLEIFNNGIRFENPSHQRVIKNINKKIDELPNWDDDYSFQYPFFKGCGILVKEMELENKICNRDSYKMAEKEFDEAIKIAKAKSSDNHFYFEAHDAKHYLYLAVEEYEKAKEISNLITENNWRNKYTIIKKIEDYIRLEKINDDELRTIQNDIKFLREQDKGAYIRFQIEINIRDRKITDWKWFDKLMNLDSNLSIEKNLGLYGKVFLIKGELENARCCFNGAIDRFSEMMNKGKWNDLNVLNIQLSANKLGLLLCRVKANNYNFNELDKLFSIPNLFKDDTGWAELNRKYLIYITESERELIRKVKI